MTIISFSSVEIKGSESKKVIVKNFDEEPFGVFGVSGADAVIDWLILEGGSERFINGIFFSGGLSLYHSDVVIKNSEIKNNKADDGLNIKYGSVLVENSIFENNFADQVDLD